MARKRRICSVGWAVTADKVECAIVAAPDWTVLASAEADLPTVASIAATPGKRGSAAPAPAVVARHPKDFLPALKAALGKALSKTKLSASDIRGAGVACEAPWIIPVQKDGIPLAEGALGKKYLHALSIPPRHRLPFTQAAKLTQLGRRIGEAFLEPSSRSVSPRSYWPRVWQMIEEAPEVVEQSDYLIEVGDWLVWTLVGEFAAGWQACSARMGPWLSDRQGPSLNLLRQSDPRLAAVASRPRPKGLNVFPAWKAAGKLSGMASRKIGLRAGTTIAAPALDSLAGLLGAGVSEQGKVLMRWNDPTTFAVYARHLENVPGVTGTGEHTLLPDSWSYEAVQLGVVSMMNWLERYRSGEPVGANGTRPVWAKQAGELKPGESGLLAMGWWEGDEATLRDSSLSGVLIGIRPDTEVSHVYRAFLESAAFGAYTILRAMDSNGVLIRQVYALGSLLEEHPLLGPILADVVGRDVYVPAVGAPSAVGAALYASVAVQEPENPGAMLEEAASKLPKPKAAAYPTHAENHRIYERLYDQYLSVYDFLGRRSNRVMHDLARLRGSTSEP